MFESLVEYTTDMNICNFSAELLSLLNTIYVVSSLFFRK